MEWVLYLIAACASFLSIFAFGIMGAYAVLRYETILSDRERGWALLFLALGIMLQVAMFGLGIWIGKGL